MPYLFSGIIAREKRKMRRFCTISRPTKGTVVQFCRIMRLDLMTYVLEQEP